MIKFVAAAILLVAVVSAIPVKRQAPDDSPQAAAESAINAIDQYIAQQHVTEEQIKAYLAVSNIVADRSLSVDERVAKFESMLAPYKLSDDAKAKALDDFRKGIELSDYAMDLFKNSGNQRVAQFITEMQAFGNTIEFYFGDHDQRVQKFAKIISILQPGDEQVIAQIGQQILAKCKEMGVPLPDIVKNLMAATTTTVPPQ